MMSQLLDYQYTYQHIQNGFIEDSEIKEKLRKLRIENYAQIESLSDSNRIVKFKFQGDKFISLTQLINLYKTQQLQRDSQYAKFILSSIFNSYFTYYVPNQEFVSFNPDDIWIGNALDYRLNEINQQIIIVFTDLQKFYKQDQIQIDCFGLQNTIKKFIELLQIDEIKLKAIQECQSLDQLKKHFQRESNCNQSKKPCLQSNLNENIKNIFDVKTELNEGLSYQNFLELKSNIINWIHKDKNLQQAINSVPSQDDLTIRDIFLKLQLETAYEILVQRENKDQIFNQLKINKILNSLSNLRNINNFIFKLTFPDCVNFYQQLNDQFNNINNITQRWISILQENIKKKIQHYIHNILEFYQGDKQIWIKQDFKRIFNKVRERINSELKEGTQIQIITEATFIIETAEQIIKEYYQEKIKQINVEIVEFLFQ